MDFAYDRLEDDSEEKFGYTAYQDIKEVNFKLKEKTFTIQIKLIKEPKIMTENLMYNYRGRFFNTAYFTAKAFCEHFGLTLVMKLNNKPLNLAKFEMQE